MDGMTIEDDDTAQAFTRAMRANSSAWGGRGMDKAAVRVGEVFELEPCVPKSWPFRTPERPCPRVELWPENDLAARIVFASLPEHTRPLIPEYIAALRTDAGSEPTSRAVLHAVSVLQSKAVADWMRAQFENAGED